MAPAVAIFALTYLAVAGTMTLSSYLAEAGFFRWASFRVLRSSSGPRALLRAIVFTAGVLSAFLANDTAAS